MNILKHALHGNISLIITAVFSGVVPTLSLLMPLNDFKQFLACYLFSGFGVLAFATYECIDCPSIFIALFSHVLFNFLAFCGYPLMFPLPLNSFHKPHLHVPSRFLHLSNHFQCAFHFLLVESCKRESSSCSHILRDVLLLL